MEALWKKEGKISFISLRKDTAPLAQLVGRSCRADAFPDRVFQQWVGRGQFLSRPRPDLQHVLAFLGGADVRRGEQRKPQALGHQLAATGGALRKLRLQFRGEITFAGIEIFHETLVKFIQELDRPKGLTRGHHQLLASQRSFAPLPNSVVGRLDMVVGIVLRHVKTLPRLLYKVRLVSGLVSGIGWFDCLGRSNPQ